MKERLCEDLVVKNMQRIWLQCEVNYRRWIGERLYAEGKNFSGEKMSSNTGSQTPRASSE